MPRRAVIAVVGSSREVEPAVSNARELGKLIAENGWVLINGGRNAGVMRAANEGAKEIEESLTIGILPDRDTAVSPSVDVTIVTDVGQARNNIIVLTADVVIACGVDGAGTSSEVSLAIKNRKPVILLGAGEQAACFFETIGEKHIHAAETPRDVILLLKRLLPDPGTVADRRQKHDR
jgi:uncharacterized protein (TIGR00725 family)